MYFFCQCIWYGQGEKQQIPSGHYTAVENKNRLVILSCGVSGVSEPLPTLRRLKVSLIVKDQSTRRAAEQSRRTDAEPQNLKPPSRP